MEICENKINASTVSISLSKNKELHNLERVREIRRLNLRNVKGNDLTLDDVIKVKIM